MSDISVEQINGFNAICKNFEGKSIAELKDIVDSIKDKTENYVIVALASNSGGVSIVVSVSDKAIKKGLHAGNMLKKIANVLGGNGGGKDKYAQGQGKDASKINDAISLAKDLING